MAKERNTVVKFEAVPGREVVVTRFRGQYSISCPGLGVRLVSKAVDVLEHVRNVILPPHPDGSPNVLSVDPGDEEPLLLSIAELALDDRSI